MRAAFEWRADSRLGFIYPKRVSSSSTCQVQCRMYSAQNDGVYAATTYYYGAFDYAHNLNPDSKNWDRCIIKVNNSYNVELSTLIHEFGHVLGLGHDTNPSSIMCKSGSGRVAISPSYSDYTLVYQKYAPYVS